MSNCKDCTKRKLGCHDKCDTYKAWKSNLNTKNSALKEQRYSDRTSLEGFWRRITKK